ncbi:MAG: AAA family ATPase [Desulfurivibrionaceae bacterium]|nr:AAA family ATPase [Desulfobulbales bacterium]MDT8335795.1 AAA family ATPase [Desulfurivibrionaceae bacterium]
MVRHGDVLPSRKELEREISKYLADKYGEKIKVMSDFPAAESEKDDTGEKFGPSSATAEIFNFQLKPEELVAYLDEYVVRQDQAKAVLATKICTHFNRIRHAAEKGRLDRRSQGQVKSNVLLIGPTGVGKTFLIKLIARKLGVPFVKGDATKFSETGYVGRDVEDLVRDLVKEAGGVIDRAEFGIIYVDEIDKIAGSDDRITHDVSRTGVQRALLKPMEETEVELKVPHDPISQLEAIEYYRTHGKREGRTVNTRNILFIMSGAFTGLEEIVKKRVGRQSIGFESTVTSKKEAMLYLGQTKAEDLIQYGFESEFVGRLPVITVLDELSEDDFYRILLNPNNSVVLGKRQDFRAYGIRLVFEDDALREVAARAVKEKTGARGLVSVLERSLLPYEKKLPSGDQAYLVVSRDMIIAPETELADLLADPGRAEFHRRRFEVLASEERERIVEFLRKSRADCFARQEIAGSPNRLRLLAEMCQEDNLESHEACRIMVELLGYIRECEAEFSSADLAVRFDQTAEDEILAAMPAGRAEVVAACERVFRICEPGLRLINRKKDIRQVVLTGEAIGDPEKFINKLVQNSFIV